MKVAKLRNANTRGYTLMEMILVLGIIALLLGTGAYLMTGVLGDGEKVKAEADIQAISGAIIRYRTNGRMYPTQQQGLEALVKRPSDGPQPSGWKQYLKPSGLTDPWQQPYQYRYPGTSNPDEFDVFSFGADRQEGTDDDIGNWEK